MPENCAAADCNQTPNQPNISFFRFPLDPERCKQWVGNCGRPDLQTKTPEYLHRNFKLCSKHFEASLIHKESELKSVLKHGAVPTVFNFKTNNDPQNRGRKRSRPPAAGDSVKAKKTKGDAQATAAEPSVKNEPGENREMQNPPPEEPEKEDPATSKAKETLKVYFKETLAFTGFSIANDAALSASKSMGSGPVGQITVNPVCAEKIESKEVLKLGEDVMREEIRNSLLLARYFSILLQDQINIEGKDQIPVFIRTVTGDGFPQKHLMGFLPCDVDSDALFLMLMSEIRSKWGLRMEHCRGFTYLTTGGLCQKLKELSSRMLRDFPQVVLAPSDPYGFNVWLIRSLPVLSIQDVVDTVEEVASILRQSETLMKKLHAKIFMAYGHIKGEVDRVKEACQNNWEYGTDAFQTMLDILEPLLNSIGEMCTSALSEVDTAIVEQLLKLKEKLKNFNFIISLVVLKNTLCCVSILNPSLKGIISISSTLQYIISNALKLLHKQLQDISIFHRKWFSDAIGRAKKLGVTITIPGDVATNGDAEAKPQPSPEDYYRETLSKMILQYLIDEVKRVLGVEMVRILRWLSLVPSYMADHNFSIRKDKVADANLNNLARPDSFYDELGCWEVKWRHASKRRILPTSVFATLKIPDIGFYPNVQSLLRVLGSIPCISTDAGVYGQYDMVLDRFRSYMKEVPAEKRLCNMAFVYVNQDVHFNIEDMVQSYVENHPDILQLLCKDDMMEVQPSENNSNAASKEDMEEPKEMTLDMDLEKQKPADSTGADKEALKSALQAAVTAACSSQSRQSQGGQEGEVEYVTKSEMNEVLKVCEDVVRNRILSEVGNSFFSLFIDRPVRFGEADFLPLFLRFVDSFDVMRLELMGFVDMSLDTESLCERLFEVVTKEWCLNLKYCRGQAYLGSGEVAYKLKAFACKVQETYPLAICTHCSCYSFNTWWSRTVPVPSVCRAIDTLERIVLFFSSMPDLEKELDQVLAVGLRESYEKVHELQGTFCSSWLEKHDSYDVFAQILEPLTQCLESFQSSSPQKWSLSVVNQAKKLSQLIGDFDFIVAIVALKNVSSFTRELSAALQKDHFSAASQLCQISGIVATLNRVKTNIKVFHQNWFDEACAFAQGLGVQIKVPDSVVVPRDSLLKPGGYYKDAVSLTLVDHLINAVKDHFSDDLKEALNFLSLVPCSVTVSYIFESLKSKPPLYVGDLPDPDNFFTELSCWKVKWKTKVVSPTIPDTIFQTLRLPLMQYFANINTLLKIMCVLPSTALEYCGEVKRHKMFQDYLRNTSAKDRSPCVAVLQVGADFNRDLDHMVDQCLNVTPKTLEGICLDKESKTLLRNSEGKEEVDNHKDEVEAMDTQQVFPKDKVSEIFPERNEVKAEVDNHKGVVEEMDTQQQSAPEAVLEGQQEKPLDENGHTSQPADNFQSSEIIFRVAARVARRNCLFSELPKEDQDCIIQELSTCQWDQANNKCLADGETLEKIVKSIRGVILSEVQESPFFSVITDKLVSVEDKMYIPVFVRYVDDCTPKVELLGYLPFDGSSDADVQAKTLADILTDEWGLQMGYCRGQSFMCMGASSQSLRKLSLDFVASYPLAVCTPSESCGLAYWLAVSLHNDPITKVLGVVEDLLLFFDQSPRLHIELAQTMEGLLNTPREALAEVPETCLSRWKKTEDFFDILVDMLEGVLSCLDSVSNNVSGSWSNSMSIHALILSTAIRESDFVIPLVILKNACAPLRNCSTVFRCGNPADIICELEKIPLIVESLSKMLENISAVHTAWFEEAVQLAVKVAGGLSYQETVESYESPEVGYRETVSMPILSGLIEEMKFNFSECHLKALKVLSLLPTCNPLPILPEATDKLYTIYQSDLPEPETVEENINTWAAAWREKYQDTQPPASISETLLHTEAKSLPNITALLKLVAVLPSISMECDLMKTTLNSLRTFLRNDIICRGSKTDTVMLLMHRQVLLTLEEVIDKCMENDPESHAFLTQMKQNVCNMRMDSEMVGVSSEEMLIETNGSGELVDAQGTTPLIKDDQPEAVSCEIKELNPTPANTPEGSAMETIASIALERIQGSPLVSISAQSASAVPDGTEISSTVCPSDHAAGGQGAVEEPTAQDVPTESGMAEKVLTVELSTVVQGVSAEVLTELEAQGVLTESITTTEDVKETVQDVATDSETADEVVAMDLTTVVQGATTEAEAEAAACSDITDTLPEVAAQGVPEESLTSAKHVKEADSVSAGRVVTVGLTTVVQGVTTEPPMEMATQSNSTEPVTELAAQNITVRSVIASEVISVELATAVAQRISTEPATVVSSQDVTIDPASQVQIVASEPVTAAADVTQKPSVIQGIITETVEDATHQDLTTEPDASENVPMEFTEAAYGAATEHAENIHTVTKLAAQDVTTGSAVASEVVTVTLAAAQQISTDPEKEVSSQDVTIDSGSKAQIVASESVPAAADVTLELSATQGTIREPVLDATVYDVTTEPDASEDVPMECTEAAQGAPTQDENTLSVTELALQDVTTGPAVASEIMSVDPAAATEQQHISPEPGIEVSSQGVTVDPVLQTHIEASEPVTTAADVTLELSATRGITSGPVVDTTHQEVTTEPDVSEGVPMEFTEAEQGAPAQPHAGTGSVTAVAAQSGTTELVTGAEEVSPKLAAAQGIIPEPAIEAVAEGLAVVAAQDETVETVSEAEKDTQDETIETVSEAEKDTQGETIETVSEAEKDTQDETIETVSEARKDTQDETIETVSEAEKDTQDETIETVSEAEKDTQDETIETVSEAEKDTQGETIETVSEAEKDTQGETIETVSEARKDTQDVSEETPNISISISKELVTTDHNVVVTEPLTAAQEVTIEPPAPVDQVIAPETVMKTEVESVITQPDIGAEDVPMEITEVVHKPAVDPVTELAAQNVTAALEVQDVPMALSEDAEGTATGPVMELAAQDVAMEPIAPASDVRMELSEAAQVTATNQVIALEVQNVTTEPVASTEDVTLDLSKTTHNVNRGVTDVASDMSKEHVTTEQAAVTESLTAVPGITNEPAVATAQGVSIDPRPASEEHMDLVKEGQRVTAECVAAEPTKAQCVTMEPVTFTKVDCTKPIVVAQDATQKLTSEVEGVATENTSEVQSISTEPRPDVQNVTTEPKAVALEIPTEPGAQSRADVQNVSTDLDIPMQPMIVAQAVPAADQDIVPTVETQSISMKPITAVPKITTKPVTAAQCVTMEPTAAVQGIYVESVLPDRQNGETVAEVATKAATEGEVMETTEAQHAASEPMEMAQAVSTVLTQDVPMHPAETAAKTVEPVATVQDVVMEPVIETQEVIREPVAEDVTMKPVADIQDVTMDPEVQNISMLATEDRDVAGKPKSATQDTELKPKGQDDTIQVAHGNNTNQSKVHASGDFNKTNSVCQDNIGRQPMVVSEDVFQVTTTTLGVSQDTAALQSSADNGKAAAEDAANQAKVTVQDTEQSVVSQDGTSHNKKVSQAAGQDEQPHVVMHDGTVPHKAVLSFYDSSAQEALIKEHVHSKFFSIIFEQHVDIEGHPYIPVGICYLGNQSLCEDILAFVPLNKDINVFVDAVTTTLSEKYGLNLAFCRGQSLLTVGVEGVQIRAVASLLSQRYPQAVCTLNSSVSLNMWLARSSAVTEIADSSMWVEKLLRWLTEDAEKLAKLQNMVTSQFQQDNSKLCELRNKLTRRQWERRHDILELTVEILPPIMRCLIDMKENGEDQAEKIQALNFLCIFQNFEFILSIVIMKNILSLTKNLSQSLQGGSLDLYQAANSLPDLLSALKNMTVVIDGHLQTWFQEAVELASKLKINVHHTSQEPLIVHYREVVSKGAIEHLISEIGELFSDQVLSALRCMQVVPYVISKMEGCLMDIDFFKVYQDDLPDWSSLLVELQRWKDKWLESMAACQPLPTYVPDALKASDIASFPNIATVLQLLMVLPCCRTEGLVRQGKKSLREFIQRPQKTLPVLYPL